MSTRTEIIHVAGPMRGSFAVYCTPTSTPVLYKRSVSKKVLIQGPAMEGSFVFYGCCPGNHVGYAKLIGPASNNIKTVSLPVEKFVHVSQGPMRGSFVLQGCPPGYTP